MVPIQGLTGFGGGATGYLVGGGGGPANPFDNMSNFSGASKASENVIYYTTTGTIHSFTDPNGGSSKFRFTVVGGGGATTGDGGGWYGVTGGGGGGAARGEIQTSQTLQILIGEGGGSPGYFGYTDSAINNTYQSDSLTFSNNYSPDRVRGRGGWSIVRAGSIYNLIWATGGQPGFYGYYSSMLSSIDSSGYNTLNGGRGFWPNGGYGDFVVGSAGGVTVSNGSTENGGTGGCAAHKSSGGGHPRDGENTYPSNSSWAATTGESTTYAGAGGGGGSDYDNDYQIGSGGTSFIAGAAGGSASGLNTLLSGSGLSSVGGNGCNYSLRGNQKTTGTLGGGAGGNSRYSTSDTWTESSLAASGVVIVEFLGF